MHEIPNHSCQEKVSNFVREGQKLTISVQILVSNGMVPHQPRLRSLS
jgi:hypothetical protein